MLMDGYCKHFEDRLITVWSAPNYCGKCGNSGAFLKLGPNLEEEVVVFEESPVKVKYVQPDVSFTSFFSK